MTGRILVTGGTGFVGRAVVAALLRQGRELTLAARRPELLPSGDLIRAASIGEIGPATDWSAALADVEVVVHLAALAHAGSADTPEARARFDRVNHQGAVRLFEEARGAGASLFAFVSTVLVLGDRTSPGRPLTDASPPSPRGPYARAKHAAEIEMTRAAVDGGTRLVILRPPLVCGPGVGGNLEALARLAALPLPLPFRGIGNRRSLIARDNLASAIARVAEARVEDPAGTFLVADTPALSTGDIVRHLQAGYGRGPGLVPAPPELLVRHATRLLGRPGLHLRLFGSLEVDAAAFRLAYGPTEVTSITEALAETGRAAARARRSRHRA